MKKDEKNTTDINETTGTKREFSGILRAVPIILAAIALFITLCFITGETGAFGSFISRFLKGLFSYVAYIIPVLLALHAVFFASDIKEGRLLSRVIFSALALLTLSEVAYMLNAFGAEMTFSPVQFYNDGIAGIGGGFIGGVITYGLYKAIGKVGVVIVITAVLAVYFIYFFSARGGAFGNFIMKKISSVLNFFAKAEKKVKDTFISKDKRREKKRRAAFDKKAEALLEDDFFSTDNGVSKLEIPELGIVETKDNVLASEKILRESIKRGNEVTTEPSEDTVPKEKRRFYGDFSEEGNGWKRTEIKDSYRPDDIVFEANEPAATPKKETSADFGLEDSAEAIFTADFNPYDIALNERYASKPSSKAPAAQSGFTENISEMSEHDIERARMAEIFEQRRKEALERMAAREKAEAEAKAKAEAEEALREQLRAQAEEQERERARLAEEERLADIARKNEEIKRQEAELRALEERRLELERLQAEAAARAAHLSFTFDADSAALGDESPEITLDEEKTEFVFSAPDDNSADEESDEAADNEYSYEDEEQIRFTEDEPSADHQPETITVSRTQIGGLDFEDDDEDEPTFDGDGEEETFFPEEIPPEEQNAKINDYRNMFDIFKSDTAEPEDEEPEDEEDIPEDEDLELSDEDEEFDALADEEDEPPFEMPEPKPEPPKADPPKKKAPDYSKYKYPSIDFLAKIEPKNSSEMNDEVQAGAENLLNALESFGIRATLRGIERGPRITRYSIVPAKGVRVGQIERLSDDISLALAAESIRIEAPIPGRSAVGVEIPNRESDIVSLRELLEAPEFAEKKSRTTVCIGKSVEGNKVFGDIADMPHLLIAGATGMGKSVCMNSLIMSMLYKARPDEVKFIMIDPKKLEFAPYNGIPHLLVPVVTEPKQAAGALVWAVDEMNRRYGVIEKLYVKNIDSYNEKIRENPELGEFMPKIVIFIDELNDLMIQVRDPVENLIMSIAQKARAAGIHLVIGTQRPSVNVITGVIKANIPARIACKVSSGVDSRTILEQIGAEKLIGKGDMLYTYAGKSKPTRVQGAFVSETETMRIVDFVKNQYKGEFYDEQAMQDMKRAAQKCDKNRSDDDDDAEESSDLGYLHDRKFLNAVELAINHGNIATSYLQRKLKIGYGKAAQYIDAMVDLGIVEEKGSSKGREVLISLSEWHEKLSRLTLDD